MTVPPLLRTVRSRTVCAWLFALGSVVLGGCSTYTPKPLDPDAVNASLQPFDLADVRVAAEQISHPLLKPLVIDGRDGFTPDEIALIAVIASPDLRALRDQRGVAQAQVLQAGILPNPQLGLAIERPNSADDPTLVNGTNVGLSWEISSLISYRDRVAAEKAAAGALDLDIAWQEWQTAQAARLAAYRILSLESRLPLVQETESRLADALDLARQAQAGGQMTLGDLAAAMEAWRAAQSARFDIEKELTAQRLALNLSLGVPPDQPIQLKAGPALSALPTDASAAAGLLDGLEQRRLDLVALTLGYESAEASLRATVKSRFPQIGLSVEKAKDTGGIRSWITGVAVDLPLFDRGQGAVALGEATRQQLYDEYTARVATARSDVTQILSGLAVAQSQLQALDAELPDLRSLVSGLDRAMETQNANAQDWRDAHVNLLNLQTEEAGLRESILELGVALEIATGRTILTPSTSP